MSCLVCIQGGALAQCGDGGLGKLLCLCFVMGEWCVKQRNREKAVHKKGPDFNQHDIFFYTQNLCWAKNLPEHY